MTREEAIKTLEYRRCLICQTCRYFHTPFVCKSCRERYCNGEKEALKMAVKALEAEPVKHGRWIWNKRLGEWYCSNCDRIMNPYTVEKSDGEYEMTQPFYCGWCGAKMDESTMGQLKVKGSVNEDEDVEDGKTMDNVR